MGNWNDESWVWNFRWCRTLYESENDAVATLKQQIDQIRPNRERVDGVYWKHSDNVGYPVKSIVEKMSNSSDPILPKLVINLVWQKILPPRAQLTV